MLRNLAFGNGCPDEDGFDSICAYVLIHDLAIGTLVCYFRLLVMAQGPDIGYSYSAQFYNLVSNGRFFCPDGRNGPVLYPSRLDRLGILRVTWGKITRFVDKREVEMLFGCSSFAGTEIEQYLGVFAILKHRSLAPKRWLPQVKAPDVFRYAARLRCKPDAKKAMLRIPPLLKTYLIMGVGQQPSRWLDLQMNTLRLFTVVEVGGISPARKRLLRAVAGCRIVFNIETCGC